MSFVRAKAPVFSRALTDAKLAALSARPGAALLDTPTCHLLAADEPIAPTTDPTTLTESTFDGYAAGALGALAGPVNIGNDRRAMHVEVDFVAGSAIVSPGELVYGYYVTNGAGTDFYWGEKFDAPLTVLSPGDFVSLDLVVPEQLVADAE